VIAPTRDLGRPLLRPSLLRADRLASRLLRLAVYVLRVHLENTAVSTRYRAPEHWGEPL